MKVITSIALDKEMKIKAQKILKTQGLTMSGYIHVCLNTLIERSKNKQKGVEE